MFDKTAGGGLAKDAAAAAADEAISPRSQSCALSSKTWAAVPPKAEPPQMLHLQPEALVGTATRARAEAHGRAAHSPPTCASRAPRRQPRPPTRSAPRASCSRLRRRVPSSRRRLGAQLALADAEES